MPVDWALRPLWYTQWHGGLTRGQTRVRAQPRGFWYTCSEFFVAASFTGDVKPAGNVRFTCLYILCDILRNILLDADFLLPSRVVLMAYGITTVCTNGRIALPAGKVFRTLNTDVRSTPPAGNSSISVTFTFAVKAHRQGNARSISQLRCGSLSFSV